MFVWIELFGDRSAIMVAALPYLNEADGVKSM
jgi:hypothetical protein